MIRLSGLSGWRRYRRSDGRYEHFVYGQAGGEQFCFTILRKREGSGWTVFVSQQHGPGGWWDGLDVGMTTRTLAEAKECADLWLRDKEVESSPVTS
jgi:hypothetical protein